MLRRGLLGTAAAIVGAARAAAHPVAAGDEVDALLVLAIDGSGSLSDARLTLQREGCARAVASAAFLDAVRAGPRGRVALAAVEWSNQDRQDLPVPWTVVEDAAMDRRFAERLLRAPRPIPGYTSISGAIDFSVRLLMAAPFRAARRVIDVSGNGPNNDGRSVAEARDDAVAAGVTVNGLPILDQHKDLDAYYAANVVSGPRAFVMVARDLASFAAAVEKRLITEIAAAPMTRTVAG
jgi:hypothetical protein